MRRNIVCGVGDREFSDRIVANADKDRPACDERNRGKRAVDRLYPRPAEFGHIEIRGKDAEKRAAEIVREEQDLSWEKWASRVDEYLKHMEAMLSPDLFIIGGGISKRAEKFVPLLTGIRARSFPRPCSTTRESWAPRWPRTPGPPGTSAAAPWPADRGPGRPGTARVRQRTV